ncbi:neutral/alkaline non-lysosomal ceramidase N-terminal domain-containing protein [Mariniphaga sediminis]|uniref:neutral/alkaline non-lysosomal ceramidase N-terminal domain-containing protein n=1 Tax=Mariniphaga sediminis TaxID=1628158 RepID=UPI0015583999|nr:neutral/alkaline non-lysosomal ceramidase N-terminal domain-containing protein [Mariniphaga sediminis]
MQWIEKGHVPETTALSTMKNRLLIISRNELLGLNLSENSNGIFTDNIGTATDIKFLTGVDNSLYGINASGELLRSGFNKQERWEKAGQIGHNVTALTSLDKTLFISNDKGEVRSLKPFEDSANWKQLDSLQDIISLAASNEKLYALTSVGILFQLPLSGNNKKWLKIAYKNEETIKENIRNIAILNDQIFGISNDNILYQGEHRSESALTARAMAIKNDNQTVIIVNMDVCGLEDTFVGALKHKIYEKYQIPASAVFINSSHTHFAPVSQNWLTWQEANQRPDSTYLNVIIKGGILHAVKGALHTMEPAQLSFGRGKTDIGYNRSLKDHQELYDSDVDVIQINYNGSHEKGYLFMAACHPVFSVAGTLHYTISANFPGVARKLVEERTNSCNSLFLQGTAGDINPKDDGEYITGEKLANEVIAITRRPMKNIEGPISFYLDTINFPVTPWSKTEIYDYRVQNINKPRDIEAEKNVKWCDLMLKYYDEGTMPETMPVYVQTINIGNWKLIGFSRETTTGYSLGVKKFWPDKMVSVAGYTNDVSSYLPTGMHIAEKNYEGLGSFFWYGMPSVFPSNVEKIILDKIESLRR